MRCRQSLVVVLSSSWTSKDTPTSKRAVRGSPCLRHFAGHSYIQNAEDREEAGTPDIVGCIRTGGIQSLFRSQCSVACSVCAEQPPVRLGLVYHLHTLLPEQMVEVR